MLTRVVKNLTVLFLLAAALLEAGCTTPPPVSVAITPKEIQKPDTGFRLERVIQAARQRYGDDGVAVAINWNDALTLFRDEPEQNKLKDINEYINRKIRLDNDLNTWGKDDYWASPLEALVKGAGDCEDYAVAKYFSLRFSGIPASKLRLSYVKSRVGGADSNIIKPHMVVTLYPAPDAEPLVLDSLINEIRPLSRRKDLIPVFSFNSEGVWPEGGATPQTGEVIRLAKWVELVEKMKGEGFE